MTNSLQGGEPWPGCAAAAPGSGPCTRCTIIPGGRLVFHVFAALAEFIRGLIAEGFALSGAATGQHGQAAALLAWLCRAPDAPVRADPGGQRRVRGADDRDLRQLRIPGFPAGTAAGPGVP